MYPLISVITVCYNCAKTLEATLNSVAEQDWPAVEHIIIDGGSTDATAEILERYRACLARVVCEPDDGIYDAMNKGIALARGDIVGFLNADDIYAEDTVLAQVADEFSNPEVDACFADLVYVDKNDMSKVVRYWKSRGYENGLFERGWMPAHPTFFVRRRIYEEYGGFDLEFPRQADFELTLRFLCRHRIRSVYVPRTWVKMRMGGVSNNSFRSMLKGNLEAYRACIKNGLNVGVTFIPRKVLSRVPQFFRLP